MQLASDTRCFYSGLSIHLLPDYEQQWRIQNPLTPPPPPPFFKYPTQMK